MSEELINSNNTLLNLYEKNIISSIMIKPELFEMANQELKVEDFSNQEYAHVFLICKNIFDETGELSPTMLYEEINNLNMNEKVINIIEGTHDYIDFSYSIQRLKEETKKRKLLNVNKELERILTSNKFEVSEMEEIYQKVLENFDNGIIDEKQEDVVEKIMDIIFERKRKKEQGKSLVEIDSGYSGLNRLTNGLHRGELVILAARPGMGKTAFMLNMAVRQLKTKNRIIIFSLEMSKELLVERMISILSGVSLQKIRWGDLNDKELNEIVKALDFLKSKRDNFVIFDKSDIRINEIKAEIRKEKRKKDVDVVYIDYLQLINSSSQYNNKNIEVGEVSRISKVMARDLDVAIVMLAQLSREVERRTNKKPVLSDLRDSGEIEQNADLVLFLYREAYYKNVETDNEEVELILAKHRNGPLGTINMAFLKEDLNFIEYERGV
mgnify:CR=1 FL=1